MFSANERHVIDIIGKRKITVQKITEQFYRNREPRIDNNNYIASVVRRIKMKCELNKLTWTIASQGSGRSGKTVWKEKRND